MSYEQGLLWLVMVGLVAPLARALLLLLNGDSANCA